MKIGDIDFRFLSDRQKKYAKYRWEFLRRNKQYIDACEELQKTVKDKYGIDIQNFSPKNSREIKKEMVDFSNRWGLVYTSPYLNADLITRSAIFHDYVYPEMAETPGFPFRQVCFEEDHAYHLTVRIDLRFPKKRLLDEFRDLIDRHKAVYKYSLFDKFCADNGLNREDKKTLLQFESFYKKIQQKGNAEFTRKYHFDNFDDYLQVYDLRVEGTSWAKIAQALKLNSVQTARNFHKAACELIEKGIDLYVK